MNDVYNDIVEGLNQAIAHAKGKKQLRTSVFKIDPIPNIKAKQVKIIRSKIRLTQDSFAKLFGVSKKTIEAWESGKNIPNGPSQRILKIIKNDPNKIELFGLIKS